MQFTNTMPYNCFFDIKKNDWREATGDSACNFQCVTYKQQEDNNVTEMR
jgi:hypothetical protein